MAARKVTSVVPDCQIQTGSRTSKENPELIHRLIDPSSQHPQSRRSLPRRDARIAAEIGKHFIDLIEHAQHSAAADWTAPNRLRLWTRADG
jgi:hypothetical protein